MTLPCPYFVDTSAEPKGKKHVLENETPMDVANLFLKISQVVISVLTFGPRAFHVTFRRSFEKW